VRWRSYYWCSISGFFASSAGLAEGAAGRASPDVVPGWDIGGAT
jgi:hypothetical protein